MNRLRTENSMISRSLVAASKFLDRFIGAAFDVHEELAAGVTTLIAGREAGEDLQLVVVAGDSDFDIARKEVAGEAGSITNAVCLVPVSMTAFALER